MTNAAPTNSGAPLSVVAAQRDRAWLALRQVGPVRLGATAVFVLIAFALALTSWSLPLLGAAERALYDLRVVTTAPNVDQDPRVVMVVYKDETLANTGRRSPLDRTLLARALTNLDALGPKAIGIDILIDQPEPEDQELVTALRNMKTPTHMGFASNKNNPGDVLLFQDAFERDFARRFSGGNSSSALVRVEMDVDGVVRHWPAHPQGEPPLLSVSMAPHPPGFEGYKGALRFRMAKFVDHPLYAELPIDLFRDPAMAGLMKSAIAGRYVLVGADISDVDRVPNPATFLTGDKPPGLKVHADLLSQLLDQQVEKPIPTAVLGLMALLAVAAGALTGGMKIPPGWNQLFLGLQLAYVAAFPYLLQSWTFDTHNVPQFGWALGWLIAYTATAAAARSVGAEQRNFAQSALGKYLPKDVAAQILRDPSRMALSGERREIYTMFSDLQGFTEMTHAVEPEMVATLLSAYLDRLSQVVLEHGGTIDKFVGDAVVAFWGAPLSRPDDGERAAKAQVAMWKAGEAFRDISMGDHPRLGRTRVGLHRGFAIVGNFGGEGRIQYTAMGDAMNTAARLEGANKQTATKMLISKEALPDSLKDAYRAMGRIRLRGRSTPVEVYEWAEDFPAQARAKLNDAYARFDAGELAALDEIRALSGEFPEDEALKGLVKRLAEAGPGGAFNLS